MGCCGSSDVEAPEVVLPDPGTDENCEFTIKSAGWFSSDHKVFRGSDTNVKENLWMIFNKEGDPWQGSGHVHLENFMREEGQKEGQILWRIVYESEPDIQKFHKAPTTEFIQFFTNFGVPDARDEPPDDVYFDKAGFNFNDGGFRRVMKYAVRAQVKILPGTRGAEMYGDEGFLLEVFCRGTGICDYDQSEHEPGGYRRQEAMFVDELQYNLLGTNDDPHNVWFGVAGDFQFGDEHPSCEVFQVDREEGGWFSSKPPVIKSGDETWDPTLGLVLGYLTTVEFCPEAIKGSVDSDFPDNPFGWPGW